MAIDTTYRLFARGATSSDVSFALPLPTELSRGRLSLMLLVARVVRADADSACAVEVEGVACWSLVKSRSLPLSFPLDLCFAALTLALVRRAFDSVEERESWSNSCGRVDALELLVASC